MQKPNIIKTILECGLEEEHDGWKLPDGDLWLENGSARRIPGVESTGNFIIRDFHALEVIGPGFIVSGNLTIECCNLERIEEHFMVMGNLMVLNCPRLRTVERAAFISGDAYFLDCPSLESLGDGFLCEGSLRVEGTKLGQVPIWSEGKLVEVGCDIAGLRGTYGQNDFKN